MNSAALPDKHDAFHLSRSRTAEIVFWTLAVLMLFLNLGIGGLRGSEGRWASVVREMFLTSDFLHPNINFEPYFDKPLMSYWAIAAVSSFNFGAVTELMIRLPSALAGLATLWATRLTASRFAGKETGVIAGWILLTVYSFPFWGRLGEADMLNLAFSALAVGWYMLNREKTGFKEYLVFGLLCAVGGQTKGLSAIAVPVLGVLADLAVSRTWKKHLNWRLFAAGAVALGAYLVPFLLAAVFNKDYTGDGLALVFQENIRRYFNSLDHKQPFYAYFIHLPQLFMPWTPLLILAVIDGIAGWKRHSGGDRWLLVYSGLVFLVFSLSDSKRVYYILPILPGCALLTARFLLSETGSRLEKIRDIVVKIYYLLIPAIALGLIAAAAAGITAGTKILKFAPPAALTQLVILTLFLLGIILCVIWTAGRKLLPDGLFRTGRRGREFALAGLAIAVLLTGFFGIILPHVNETMRTEKPFFEALRQYLREHRSERMQPAFYFHGYSNASFYLDQPRKIEVIDREGIVDPERPGEGLEKLIAARREHPVMVVGQIRYFRKIHPPALRQQILDSLTLVEPSGPWENPKKNGKKYAAFILPAK
ncbi:MAG: glycosyltransferase family 39 protein [Lentisphaeria bacterium]|nr:glycosyltransferase family 39 protein [Lentisphaeria bacterium]